MSHGGTSTFYYHSNHGFIVLKPVSQQSFLCSIDLGSYVRDGICVDPPLYRGTSQGKYGSYAKGLVCVGEIVRKIGEVGERELVLVVSVRCGKERDMTRG